MSETTVEKITRNRFSTIICTIFVAVLVAIISKDFYLLFHEEKVSVWLKVNSVDDIGSFSNSSFLVVAWYSVRWCIYCSPLARPLNDRLFHVHVRSRFQKVLPLHCHLPNRHSHGIGPPFMGRRQQYRINAVGVDNIRLPFDFDSSSTNVGLQFGPAQQQHLRLLPSFPYRSSHRHSIVK